MHASPIFGVLSYDTAHLLGGATLVLSFLLLFQRRVAAMINVYALQSLALAAAAAWQGWAQGALPLYLAALIAFAANGIAIPIVLHRMPERKDGHRETGTALGVFSSIVLGLALMALAILVVPSGVMRETLSFPLSVVLLGMLAMIVGHNALSQVIGFLSLENGLMLAAVGIGGTRLVVELSAAALVLIAFVVLGAIFLGIRERPDGLEQLGEANS